jgi:hypothetical protein
MFRIIIQKRAFAPKNLCPPLHRYYRRVPGSLTSFGMTMQKEMTMLEGMTML